MEFTTEELKDIDIGRIVDDRNLTKYIVIKLYQIKKKILIFENKLPEKSNCFCASGDRKKYRTEFYIYYDEFIKNNQTPTIENI